MPQPRLARIFRSIALLLCLSAVGSGLRLPPQAAAMGAQSEAQGGPAVGCPAERQALVERATDRLLEQAQHAISNDRLEQASQLLMAALQNIEAMEDSPAKVALLQRLVGSLEENVAFTGSLEQLVSAVAPNSEAALAALGPAVEAARGISSSYSAAKTRTLVKLANYYAQMEQPDRSRAVLAEALAASRGIQGAAFQTPALRGIAAAYINVGQADLALPLLAQLQTAAQASDPVNPYRRAAELEQIAWLYAQARQPDRALQVLRLIDLPQYPSNALLAVVDQYSEAGQIDRAQAVVAEVQVPEKKALALAILAGRLATQQPTLSAQIYQQAEATARSAQTPNQAAVDMALRYVAVGGLVEIADDTVLSIANPLVQAPALGAIALQYAKAGQADLAAARLTQAITTLGAITDDWSRNTTRQLLIDQMVVLGRYDYAGQIIAAVQAGEEMPFERIDLLAMLAERALAANRYDAALQVTEQIPPGFIGERDRLLPQIARGLAATGELDRALAIAQQETSTLGFRPRTLAEVAAQLALLGQEAEATALFDQAMQLASAIEDAQSRAEVLTAIALAYLDVDRPEAAAPVLDQVLAAAQTIADPASRTHLLRTAAEQLIVANYYQPAIKLAAAIPEETERLVKLREALEKATAAADMATVLNGLDQVEDPALKTFWLLAAVDGYIQLAQPQAAAAALDRALQTARTIPGEEVQTIVARGGESPLIVDDDFDRGSLLGAIAVKYAQLGQPAEAQRVAQGLETPAARQQILEQIRCDR